MMPSTQEQILEPSLADVFITNELDKRAPKKIDYLQEKLALQDLAACMADQPEVVLPRFVDLAMEMAHGVSAGLSLYEANPAPGVFRWQYLRGLLEPFNGATTPRNFSPCGITLDLNTPVLSMHPERAYSWIADANIKVPELLLVPLYIHGKIPLGTLWVVSDKVEHFDGGHARVLTELATFVGIALRMLETERRLQRSLDEQETLTKEMSHRLKNMFAMTDGLIRMSARGAANKDELAKILSGRLHALASANALVRRDLRDVGALPRASELDILIRAIIRPHEGHANAANPRFSLRGPAVRCGGNATNSIALVFHELATNAAKYGALSIDEGSVDISWQQREENLVLRWVELGGPQIESPPLSSGFGSKLTETAIVRQFGGTLDYEWRPNGLAVTISLPIERLST